VASGDEFHIYVMFIAFCISSLFCGLSSTFLQGSAQTGQTPVPDLVETVDLKNPITDLIVNDNSKTVYAVTQQLNSSVINEINLTSSGEVRSIPDASCPSTSDNGSIIVYYEEKGSQVALSKVNSQGISSPLALYNTNPNPTCPHISGDGTVLLIDHATEGGGYDLVTHNLSAAAQERSESSNIAKCEVCSFSSDEWLNDDGISSDGRLVSFTVIRAGHTTGSEGDYDTAKIFFSNGTSGPIDIAKAVEQPLIISGGGSNPNNQVFEEPQGIMDGAGTFVVYHSRGNGDAGIYVATKENGKQHIGGTNENDFSPVINREGNIIAYWEGNDIVIKKFLNILRDPENFEITDIKNAVSSQSPDPEHSPILEMDGRTIAFSEGSTVHIYDITSFSG
jgi:hypothetical protein